MQFEAFDKFRQGNDVWLEGVLVNEESTRESGKPEYIAAVVRQSDQQVHILNVTGYAQDGQTVNEVELRSHPEQEGATLQNLPQEIRGHLASALETASARNGKKLDAELGKAIAEGRDLEAEREQEAEYTRMTRNVDHDLEAAYITRDALKEKALTALDEGRDGEAKEAMEQLGEVQQSIKDYWNPHKPRPMVSQPLSEDEELEVQLAEMTSDEELTQEAATLAIAEFGKQAADALSRGDVEAHDAAIAKVREYQNVHKSLNDAEKAAFEQAEKDAEGTEYAVDEDSHVARLEQRRAQERKSERGMS